MRCIITKENSRCRIALVYMDVTGRNKQKAEHGVVHATCFLFVLGRINRRIKGKHPQSLRSIVQDRILERLVDVTTGVGMSFGQLHNKSEHNHDPFELASMRLHSW
jgi:hypothetical protein